MEIFKRLMSEEDKDGFGDSINIVYSDGRLHIAIENTNSIGEDFICSASLDKEEIDRFLRSLNMATALL